MQTTQTNTSLVRAAIDAYFSQLDITDLRVDVFGSGGANLVCATDDPAMPDLIVNLISAQEMEELMPDDIGDYDVADYIVALREHLAQHGFSTEYNEYEDTNADDTVDRLVELVQEKSAEEAGIAPDDVSDADVAYIRDKLEDWLYALPSAPDDYSIVEW